MPRKFQNDTDLRKWLREFINDFFDGNITDFARSRRVSPNVISEFLRGRIGATASVLRVTDSEITGDNVGSN